MWVYHCYAQLPFYLPDTSGLSELLSTERKRRTRIISIGGMAQVIPKHLQGVCNMSNPGGRALSAQGMHASLTCPLPIREARL